jgi:hypothetical protein
VIPIRDVAHIWETWYSTEPKVGDRKPCSRVTVEKNYWLRPSGSEDQTSVVVGTWNRGPARWFQRADMTEQVETEIPNIKTINIDRSIDSDAGTCTITVANTANLVFGEPEETEQQVGKPGYFTWNRGASQEALARWGQTRNPWYNVLVPNALLRTYQGYGGHDQEISEAIEDGNLVLTGVWLIDEVRAGTGETLEIKCRDMAKLLIEQMLYPPLVPRGQYPLRYFRYVVESYAIAADAPPGPIHEIVSQTTGSTDGLGDYVDGPSVEV